METNGMIWQSCISGHSTLEFFPAQKFHLTLKFVAPSYCAWKPKQRARQHQQYTGIAAIDHWPYTVIGTLESTTAHFQVLVQTASWPQKSFKIGERSDIVKLQIPYSKDFLGNQNTLFYDTNSNFLQTTLFAIVRFLAFFTSKMSFNSLIDVEIIREKNALIDERGFLGD